VTRRVRVRDTCVGTGLCESIAPQLFVLDDSQRAQTLKDAVEVDELDDARQAVASCPMIAIEIDGE
jgi:ferredoxin